MSVQLDPRGQEPLQRFQQYLIALKTCTALLRDLFVEIKDLLVIITVILFFALGVYEALCRLLK